jgi:cell division protein FtsQ
LTITQLHMDSRHAYRITLSNGIVVLLGRENMHDRLKRFARVYNKVLATRAGDIERIDTRYSNGLAIGWNKNIQK